MLSPVLGTGAPCRFAARGLPIIAMARPDVDDDFIFVRRAEVDALKSELSRVKTELAHMREALEGGNKAEGDKEGAQWEPDQVEQAFEAVDIDGDGVLTLEEFRRGYALLAGDSVAVKKAAAPALHRLPAVSAGGLAS